MLNCQNHRKSYYRDWDGGPATSILSRPTIPLLAAIYHMYCGWLWWVCDPHASIVEATV